MHTPNHARLARAKSPSNIEFPCDTQLETTPYCIWNPVTPSTLVTDSCPFKTQCRHLSLPLLTLPPVSIRTRTGHRPRRNLARIWLPHYLDTRPTYDPALRIGRLLFHLLGIRCRFPARATRRPYCPRLVALATDPLGRHRLPHPGYLDALQRTLRFGPPTDHLATILCLLRWALRRTLWLFTRTRAPTIPSRCTRRTPRLTALAHVYFSRTSSHRLLRAVRRPCPHPCLPSHPALPYLVYLLRHLRRPRRYDPDLRLTLTARQACEIRYRTRHPAAQELRACRAKAQVWQVARRTTFWPIRLARPKRQRQGGHGKIKTRECLCLVDTGRWLPYLAFCPDPLWSAWIVGRAGYSRCFRALYCGREYRNGTVQLHSLSLSGPPSMPLPLTETCLVSYPGLGLRRTMDTHRHTRLWQPSSS